jgi:hypothetical protein
MGQAIPTQHPAVVLRSRFNQLRALLAVALIAVIGLSIAVVIVANDEAQVRSTSAARPAESIRYGGLNPSTHQPVPPPQPEHPLQSRLGNTRSEGASGKDNSKNAATGDNTGDAPENPNRFGARTH